MTGRPIFISVIMHCLAAVLAIVGLPSLKRDLPEDMPLVVMEIVQTVPETNLIEGNKPSTAKKKKSQPSGKSNQHRLPNHQLQSQRQHLSLCQKQKLSLHQTPSPHRKNRHRRLR